MELKSVKYSRGVPLKGSNCTFMELKLRQKHSESRQNW